MKILFASDTSFHYMGDNYPGDEIALSLLAEAKPCFDAADFSVINLESPIGRREECTPIPKSGPNIMIFTPFKKCLEALSHFEKYMKAITAPIEDDALLARYFDAWCFGRNTLEAYPICYERGERAVVKNLLGCEAHNEVLKNEARLWFEGAKKEDYRELLEDIAALQRMEIPQSLAE